MHNSPDLWHSCYPVPQRDGNKYDRGSALIYGGEVMTGAARLAARAAQRIGAGLVTIATPAKALPIYAEARLPEVWFIDPKAKTVEVLTLQGAKYLVEATYAGHHLLTSNLFPGWQLSLDDLFDFRGRF